MNTTRRNFVKGMAATAAVFPFTKGFSVSEESSPVKKFPVSFFTKALDNYEVPFMAETLAMAGIDGFDLTVRPGGRVEPQFVERDLPLVVDTGRKAGLQTDMLVTSILSVEDPYAETILKTAAGLGVKHYRMGWYKYDLKAGIEASLRDIRQKLERLAQLNEKTGIQAGYQNHSGSGFGAPVWDAWQLIRDLPVARISSQFDVRHAIVEGANTWILALHLMKNHIGSLAIKDFTWEITGNTAKIINVPLGKGLINFDQFFKTLRELNIVAPISLHIEYPLLDKAGEELPILQKQKIMVSKIKQDLNFIKNMLDKYQLE